MMDIQSTSFHKVKIRKDCDAPQPFVSLDLVPPSEASANQESSSSQCGVEQCCFPGGDAVVSKNDVEDGLSSTEHQRVLFRFSVVIYSRPVVFVVI